ncbi:TetR/AcrR family transcriptional regulator [Marinigracilibium pacificum]|uniref:TetR/AcrR family transcriptional regulator n=1 Tax=Marinigracilibium pacificum TaxID=2729599 RepID=A0A848JCG4_9BACT|nr:TetR/AcrR family transcriptional regulator [Marinigracilibium pacificum]NMM50692.1 TetR/AcrR family transcriptional regulator [Marinigracilibium pacificum]
MTRKKNFDQDLVLEKAIELFWQKGFAATSMQDLVDHLGISRSSLYDTYGGKENLFKESFALYRSKNIERVKSFLESQPDVKEGLRKLFEYAIEESVNDEDRKGCFVVNTTTELVPSDNKLVPILKSNKASFENLFFEYLKKGEDSNQITKGKDLKSIASLLFTIYNGLKVVGKIAADKKSLTSSVSLVLSLLD